MSEFLHPGNHPDADQLSAFAEHVLPDHERLETLAHLAECADCRHIVFLAQRAQETQAPLADAALGRFGWLRNWRNLWPVAAALACGLLVVAAFLQRRHSTDVPQKSDIAFESAAPVPPSRAQLPQPVVPGVPPSGPAPLPKSSTTARVASSLRPAPASPHSGVGGIASVHSDLATDHVTNNLSVFSPNAPATGRQSANASSGSSSLGSVIGSPVAQAPPLQEQKNNPLDVNGAQTVVLQSQNQLFSQQATAPRSSSELSQSDIQHNASQTVSIPGAAPALQTESAVVSASVFSPATAAQAKSIRTPLPSKRPAVSTISNGLETLAVDSAGDLFICEDAGIRWRRVAHQWTGKAIKVSVASPASTTQPVPGKSLSAGATASTNFETATPAAVAPRVGFELTTDIGAIWSSPDGLVWKQR
jgi:hypothetical protein